MVIYDKKNGSKSVFSSQNSRYGHQNICLSKPYLTENPFYKIMKNSQVGAEKLGKSADFVISLISFTLMLLDRMFLNIFTNSLLR